MQVTVKNGSYMEQYEVDTATTVHTDDVVKVLLAESGRYIFRLTERNTGFRQTTDESGELVYDDDGDPVYEEFEVETHQWITDTALTTADRAAEWIGNISQAAASALLASA